MEPTGSTANFSWNHLSGLANLSRLLGPSPWFLALPRLPPPLTDIATKREGTRRWQWEQKGILCPADLRSTGRFQPVSHIWILFDPWRLRGFNHLVCKMIYTTLCLMGRKKKKQNYILILKPREGREMQSRIGLVSENGVSYFKFSDISWRFNAVLNMNIRRWQSF